MSHEVQPAHNESEYFFIKRPTVAIVLSIILVIFGIVALKDLPISQYPEVIPPEIQVKATYTGADAVAVENSVAAPLEQKINGVENMIYMKSTNANDGTTTIRVNFEVGSDLDMSNVLTQNRVSEGMPSLPEEVKRLGVSVKKSLSFPLMLVSLVSDGSTYDEVFLSNYANINIVDTISRVAGVGQVNLFGGSDYAMRIWVSPDRLASLGLTIPDIIKTIQSQNVIAPGGQIAGPPTPKDADFTYMVKLNGRLSSPEEFGQIILKSGIDGSQVRLSDIARIELGSQMYNSKGRLNAKPSAVLAVYQTPGSNALEVSKQIKKTVEELSKNFPQGLTHKISLDTTLAVTAGIEEVKHTFIEAIILVVIVVFVFLQNWRATIIPCLTVPVSLIATFAAFPLLGFSVNTLSLLGLVLAIGIVVDDAIVVVEAVIHHMQHGLNPRQATQKAMKEVAGPVIAIALILSAVFIPVVFMGGISGRFYQQFAVTIAISVLFSAISALTLTPALCSLMLKPISSTATGPLGFFFNGFNKVFDAVTGGYLSIVKILVRRLLLSVGIILLVVFGTGLSGKSIPLGFIPEEDQGYLLGALQLPDAASMLVNDEAAKKVEEVLMADPAVADVTTIVGFSLVTQVFSTNNTFFFISLKPWALRSDPAQQALRLSAILNKKLAENVGNGAALVFGPPAIPGLGNGAGFSMFIQDRQGSTPEYLSEQASLFLAEARKRPEIGRIGTTFSSSVPQVFANLDRDKAFAQGVSVSEVNQSLGAYLGSAYVNDFNKFGRLYKVYVQAEAEFRDSEKDLQSFYVKNKDGKMVSLASLLTTGASKGPEFTNRFNMYRAAELTGLPAPGYTSTQALNALEEVARTTLPSTMGYAWNAMSYQEKVSGGGALVFILGISFVFLILAAQYESWALPFSVLLGTPFAVFGAFGGLWLSRMMLGESYLNNIFAQIGVLTLVGLAAKNAILIVEFARQEMAQGKEMYEAVLEAARLRFRPILMTAFAFILGVVPLVLASGAGAEGRKVMGMAVFSGMLVATIFGVLLIPVLFLLVEKTTKLFAKS
jgi:hydrophobe/amphiphile efflux-1 (HAE1) family protein